MTREEVFEIVKSEVAAVLPEVAPAAVTLDGCLVDLGANSVERAEIAVNCMAALRLKIPAVELGAVEDLAALVDLLMRHAGARR
jgi:polyketide biosynthesis acyl carrier protein